ncbi:MAG: hypothetical protein HC794_05650 [Nitrospiraceae bacterium]|nr:hypothetical protein [Nitrospiraceae bacterium]
MTIPLDRVALAPAIRIPPPPEVNAADLTSKSWFECGDREREAGEDLAALAAYGRAADAALAEDKNLSIFSALDAWIEQAALYVGRKQSEELARLGERMLAFVHDECGNAPAGGLLRASVFAHFVVSAAFGKTGPLLELVLNVRAVRLGGELPRANTGGPSGSHSLDETRRRLNRIKEDIE